MVEDNQQGVNSPACAPDPYSGVQESGVAQFVEWYCQTLSAHRAPEAMAAE